MTRAVACRGGSGWIGNQLPVDRIPINDITLATVKKPGGHPRQPPVLAALPACTGPQWVTRCLATT